MRLFLAIALASISQIALGHSKGAVASEASACSRIGVNFIKEGGNAADALVGTVFCTGVIGMYHSGIGGGGFMLVRSSNGSYEFIDFRETAPAAAFQDMYNDNVNASLYGGLASGVPGEIRGLEHLHKGYGKLPWAHLIHPAIQLARYGFPVSKDLVNQMNAAVAGIANFLVEDPTWALDFAPNGTQVGLGDVMTRKRYADTLEQIAIHGPDAFYHGAIARTTIAALQKANGTMTLDDLKNYTVAIRKPAEITYHDYKLTACSAPSSGTVALSALKIVEGYKGFGDLASVNLSTHRLDEATRFGYGERANLGDPFFVNGLDEYQKEMINETTAEGVRSRLSDSRTLNVADYDPKGLESLATPGTSHVVTADASGMAVTLTSTVNLLFGSHLMVPETGVICNNEMNDFSIPGSSNAFGYVPSPSNYVRPGKRPLSSISPVIVEHLSNSSLYFVVGAAGGSRILTATIQNLWHVLDQGTGTGAKEQEYLLAPVPVPVPVPGTGPKHQTPSHSLSRKHLAMLLLLLALIGTWLSASVRASLLLRDPCDTVQKGYQCDARISHNWGEYSPWFDVRSGISTDVPDDCDITFAQVLARHGARFPTTSKSTAYAQLIKKIQSSVTQYKGKYAFLKDYNYTLGAEDLTTFGQQEMVNMGIDFFNRYQDLTKKFTPFVRASSQNRVVVSAQKFDEGYHQTKIATAPDPDYPYNIVVISEAAGSNNTLNHELCTAFETLPPYSITGSSAQNTYQATFVPAITARLNENLPGANITATDTISFMDLCPFNTVDSPTGAISPFCDLFTGLEWREYGYYQSLGKYYGYGAGNALGPTQGVGFSNELIARLTNTPVNDHTSVNHTLDDNPATFPVGASHPLFADFSHDNDLTSIFAALNLYTPPPLSNTTLEKARDADGYSAAWTVPFAARAYFEKMQCRGTTGELVRVIVNGRVVPLQGCGADSKLRCELEAFVQSLGFVRGGGKWEDCFH